MPNLSWLGKDKVVTYHQKVAYHFLDKKFSVGNSENAIIHGDNLIALKSLLPRYENKIKCIYIDPPYNTGNENWIYNDNVSDSRLQKWLGQVVGKEGEDLTRHDKWLCMMYPRLRLLQKLLSDDGAIFISIDDTELFNLKFVCDEIFGVNNFISNISNVNKPSGRTFSKFVATAHEYILIYAKNIDSLTWKGFKPEEKVTKRFNKIDKDGRKYRETDLRKTGDFDLREDRPNLFYYFYYNETTGDFFPDTEDKMLLGYVQIKPIRADGMESVWRWSIDLARQNLSAIFPKYLPTRKVWSVMQKDYLDDKEFVKPTSSWTFKDVNSERGTETFINLGFDKKDFPKPKPVGTLERILQLVTEKNSLVLDAFAGSGTTAHAVINLNKADGGNRKFILIELNDYAENITAERVKRVGGEFNFYEIGAALFDDDDFINDAVPFEKICEYIYFAETGNNFVPTDEKNLLGVDDDTAYYYFGGENLSWTTLSKIKTRAKVYVIYAEACNLSEDEMMKYNIHFRQIPFDIRRY